MRISNDNDEAGLQKLEKYARAGRGRWQQTELIYFLKVWDECSELQPLLRAELSLLVISTFLVC